nr:MAG TPA: hypothetical protein [Caudoviricetes sp.]
MRGKLVPQLGLLLTRETFYLLKLSRHIFATSCNIKAPLMLHIVKRYEWLIGAECRLRPRHPLSTKQVFY